MSLDAKRRVQVPYKWRPEEPAFKFWLLLSVQENLKLPCITAMPPDTYKKMIRKLDEKNFFDAKAEALRRNLGGNSDDAQMDKAGRIGLPDWMAKAAGLEKVEKVVLVGLFDRFQIWLPEHYAKVNLSDNSLVPEAKKEI